VFALLNLSEVYPQIIQLADWETKRSTLLAEASQLAFSELNNCASNLASFSEKLARAQTSWLIALPRPFKGEKLALGVPPISSLPTTYAALAIDGSQIEPDRHIKPLFYLINIGRVLISYGEGGTPKLTNQPFLFFQQEDIYEEYSGELREVAGNVLAIKRLKLEATELERWIKQVKGKIGVAFFDGSLILWYLGPKPETVVSLNQTDLKRQTLSSFLNLFDTAERLGFPVIGYISAPRSTDLVNSLKVSLCPLERVDCDKCPFSSEQAKPCAKVEGLNDTYLFAQILKPGERSILFESSSKILGVYGRHRIYFFYLHVNTEVVRVEIPKTLCQSRANINLIQAIVYDQSIKGRGYPVVLTEAHEQAAVKGADREALFTLLRREAAVNHLSLAESSKSLSKRKRFV
jgi:hypothetical protein